MRNLSERYGTTVFSDQVMREYLPSDTYAKLNLTIKQGKPLDLEVANSVAHGMKEWALSHGATHYAHWFQPLTGITSEKHDAFLEPCHDGTAITKFTGKELVQGEPDASSFPSGGLRATFEARGYSAWDPTSYAFIKDEVLCIPTAFCSYNGEALDKKTPLLRSISAIEKQSKRVLALFGKHPSSIQVNVGNEQEYFLIPEEVYAKRQDLIMCGRTLFGAPPCKGQELDEHYFGAIRPTVNAFMKELDDVLWGFAIAAKTKHNEVAPAQHELAPVFCNVNRAVDENLLTMEEMRLLASHHDLVCLQHEKPFEGINGSGKHNNWSFGSESENFLDPGDAPEDNLQFAVILTCVIEAVDNYQDLLRMSTASCGNDHRLGAHEAPPAIVSIFLGDELSGVVEGLVSGQLAGHVSHAQLDFGVDVLPTFDRDTTDRNRTSPFAFTGNKFEFRMPGSSQNVSDANLILNTAVAKSLKDFADAMEVRDTSVSFEHAALEYARKTLSEHTRILFSGDGYAEEWEREAERRGLSNLKTTADALPCFVSQKSIDLFGEMGVLTEPEVRSRYEVKLEKYNKLMNIEATTMLRMARRTYLPVISAYATKIAKGITTIEGAQPTASMAHERRELEMLLAGVDAIYEGIDALRDAHDATRALADAQEQADAYAHTIAPLMERLRASVDAMEPIVARDYWPVPTYDDILFYM
ncbi:glutamine synthetase III family protein [Slackia exigua]